MKTKAVIQVTSDQKLIVDELESTNQVQPSDSVAVLG